MRRNSQTRHRKRGGVRSTKTRKMRTKGTTLDVKSPIQIPSFEKLLNKKGGLTLVFIYADWCPHCHDYKPTWKNISAAKGRNVNMVAVNEKVISKTSIPNRATIDGYPTVIAVNGTTGDTATIPNFRDENAMKTLAKTGSNAVVNAMPSNKMTIDESVTQYVNRVNGNATSATAKASAKTDEDYFNDLLEQSEGNVAARTPTPYPRTATVNAAEAPRSDEDFVESLGYKPEEFNVIESKEIAAQRGGRRLRRLRSGY